MSTDNNQKLRDAFIAGFAPDMSATAVAVADAWLNQEITYRSSIPLSVLSSTPSNLTLDSSTLMQFRVKTFKVTVDTNVTSVNTNVALFQLVYNNGAATGADTLLANINTSTIGGAGTGDLVAGVPYSFTLNSTNVIVPINSTLAVKITKAGAGGLLLPGCTFEVKGVPA